MEDMELICLQIISNAGEARSESMAALAAARNSRFDEAGEHLAAAGDERGPPCTYQADYYGCQRGVG